MSVINALEKRVSTRAFSPNEVSKELLATIFKQAQSSPSNCNVQPWQCYVVSGKTKDLLKDKLISCVVSGAKPNPDFNWLPTYEGVHRDRQFGSANTLYTAMGIAREDKQARQMAMIRNWCFFDAPHAVFFTMDKYLDIMGAVDLGIYAQSLALVMTEKGVASCMQGALGQFPDPVREVLGIPEQRGILFGMSFGYADDSAPANSAKTEREQLDNAVSFFD
ncbi:nitroreductase [Thalassotalea atypica]|uniref:nitroreductase n=1 Tax=Thalassotalea atypica TaxID=2054316 RepID=UPI00257259C6|nr:nitroreductase [Thalassotalea atypica]